MHRGHISTLSDLEPGEGRTASVFGWLLGGFDSIRKKKKGIKLNSHFGLGEADVPPHDDNDDNAQ